jgi:predicted phage terminase large subunit-like protein
MDLNVELLPWQKEVFEDNHRFKIVAAGRRCGKSRLAAWMLLIRALQTEKGHVFYVAPTQGQARDILWDMLLDLGQDVITGYHINNLQITLINGAKISLKGGDRPDTMRGVSLKFLVLDEYAGIKPDVWELILRPALADQRGDALFIGTPEGRNHFYDLYLKAEKEVDGYEDYKAWHFTSYDNPTLATEEIDTAKNSMSSYAFRQEFMASFEALGSEMFKEEWVKFSTESPKSGQYYIAVDLAGFEDSAKARKLKNARLDDSAIAIVKVNQAGWYVEDIITGRWDLNTTANKIFWAVNNYKPVAVGIEKGIAKQAVLSPLQDLMRQNGRFFEVKELTHGNRKKTDRIMWALQGRFENGKIALNKGEWNYKFLDQLFQFPDPLTHDDMVDALAYIDQLAQITYASPFGDQFDELDTAEPLDLYAGY